MSCCPAGSPYLALRDRMTCSLPWPLTLVLGLHTPWDSAIPRRQGMQSSCEHRLMHMTEAQMTAMKLRVRGKCGKCKELIRSRFLAMSLASTDHHRVRRSYCSKIPGVYDGALGAYRSRFPRATHRGAFPPCAGYRVRGPSPRRLTSLAVLCMIARATGHTAATSRPLTDPVVR